MKYSTDFNSLRNKDDFIPNLRSVMVSNIIEKYGFIYDPKQSFNNRVYDVEIYTLGKLKIAKASFGDYVCYDGSGDEITLDQMIDILNGQNLKPDTSL